MKTLKIITVILLVISWTIQSPAKAEAPSIPIKQVVTVVPIEPKTYALNSFSDYGWSRLSFPCLDNLWTNESHWNSKADNPNSTAFGIAQKLGEDSKSAVIQIDNGLRYISNRYGNPCAAWKFWQSHYWY